MIKRLVLSSLLAATTLGVAQADVDKTVDYRQSIFTIVGWNFGPLRAMAQGKIDFDAAKAQRHAGRISQMSMMIDDAFPPDSINGDSDALPGIWENWEDFQMKASNLQAAASALVEAAATGDQESTTTAFAKLGGACKACHDDYKD